MPGIKTITFLIAPADHTLYDVATSTLIGSSQNPVADLLDCIIHPHLKYQKVATFCEESSTNAGILSQRMWRRLNSKGHKYDIAFQIRDLQSVEEFEALIDSIGKNQPKCRHVVLIVDQQALARYISFMETLDPKDTARLMAYGKVENRRFVCIKYRKIGATKYTKTHYRISVDPKKKRPFKWFTTIVNRAQCKKNKKVKCDKKKQKKLLKHGYISKKSMRSGAEMGMEHEIEFADNEHDLATHIAAAHVAPFVGSDIEEMENLSIGADMGTQKREVVDVQDLDNQTYFSSTKPPPNFKKPDWDNDTDDSTVGSVWDEDGVDRIGDALEPIGGTNSYVIDPNMLNSSAASSVWYDDAETPSSRPSTNSDLWYEDSESNSSSRIESPKPVGVSLDKTPKTETGWWGENKSKPKYAKPTSSSETKSKPSGMSVGAHTEKSSKSLSSLWYEDEESSPKMKTQSDSSSLSSLWYEDEKKPQAGASKKIGSDSSSLSSLWYEDEKKPQADTSKKIGSDSSSLSSLWYEDKEPSPKMKIQGDLPSLSFLWSENQKELQTRDNSSSLSSLWYEDGVLERSGRGMSVGEEMDQNIDTTTRSPNVLTRTAERIRNMDPPDVAIEKRLDKLEAVRKRNNENNKYTTTDEVLEALLFK